MLTELTLKILQSEQDLIFKERVDSNFAQTLVLYFVLISVDKIKLKFNYRYV